MEIKELMANQVAEMSEAKPETTEKDQLMRQLIRLNENLLKFHKRGNKDLVELTLAQIANHIAKIRNKQK